MNDDPPSLPPQPVTPLPRFPTVRGESAYQLEPAPRPAMAMRPRRRRVWLPLFLFLATCVSTFSVGMSFSNRPLATRIPTQLGPWESVVYLYAPHASAGLRYMGALMGILLAHEMGHFLQAVRYSIPASLPFFIPVPFSPFGTMGAVIGMDGLKADRRELFDLGISGPLAGLVIAIPITYFGVLHAPIAPVTDANATIYHDPILITQMIRWLRPEVPEGRELLLTPFLAAGWIGMLITGLNMMPISQLDGGHVIYGLFGRHGNWLARAFFVVAIGYILVAEAYIWTTMLVIVALLGPDHPPTANDQVPLGPVRWILGLLSLAIPVLCFPIGGITFGN